jgi:hypothetical protein
MPEALPHEPILTTPGSPSHSRQATLKVLSRNIDKVVLGNLLFDTWYFSPYPESILYGTDHPSAKPIANGEHKNGSTEKIPAPMIPELHVCPFCFRYTTNPKDYVSHIQRHTADAEADPDEWWPVPKTALKVYEWEGYTVWDIDGEQEKFYCQNLSLFAKLFLEQKSVFFDTSGFHYFVLTYSPATDPPSPSTGKARGRRRSSFTRVDYVLKTRVLGFFSKESLSWDSNNLACILVFPPYQHRNLGQLLMAVSYKLSGWEWEDSVIGGPEKPLSALGRKSYLRFWSERVARFFMGQTADSEGRKVFGTISKKRTTLAKEEMTIKQIGERTGMLPEDVIAALNEMGVCESVPHKRKKKSDDHQAQADRADEALPTTMLVKRSQVLVWAERNKVDLIGPVKEEGFLGEWALSDPDEDESGERSSGGESVVS